MAGTSVRPGVPVWCAWRRSHKAFCQRALRQNRQFVSVKRLPVIAGVPSIDDGEDGSRRHRCAGMGGPGAPRGNFVSLCLLSGLRRFRPFVSGMQWIRRPGVAEGESREHDSTHGDTNASCMIGNYVSRGDWRSGGGRPDGSRRPGASGPALPRESGRPLRISWKEAGPVTEIGRQARPGVGGETADSAVGRTSGNGIGRQGFGGARRRRQRNLLHSFDLRIATAIGTRVASGAGRRLGPAASRGGRVGRRPHRVM